MNEEGERQPRHGIQRRLVLIGMIQLAVFFVIVLLYLPFLNNEMDRNIENQREVANTVKRKEVETVAKLLAFEMGRFQNLNDLKAYCFSRGKTLGVTGTEFDPEFALIPMRCFLWEKASFIEDIVYIDLLTFAGDQVLNITPYGFTPKDYSCSRINPVILEGWQGDFFQDLKAENYERVDKLTPLPSPRTVLAMLSTDPAPSGKPAASEGPRYLQRYLMPLYAEGMRWGTVRMVISTRDLRRVDVSLQDNERFKVRSLIAFALTLCAGFFVGMMVLSYSARQVAAPIGALRREMQTFSRSRDFSQLLGRIDAIKFDGEDEVGLLAQTFRDMAQQLRDTLEQLQQSVATKEHALKELKESYKMLQESAKLALLGELGASFAHEINNKIQPAKITLLALIEDAAEFKVKRADMELVVGCINDVASFVDRFRTFARPQHAFSPDVDLNAVVRDALMLMGKTFQKANIYVQTDLAPNLPRIYGDENELGQVFVNLLMNARDAVEQALGPQKASGNVTVRTYVEQDVLKAQVADDGIGMTPEVHEKLFTPFFTTKGRARGTGLGLSIVKRILDGHNATVTCETQPGKGTTFTIVFRT
jgi:signal transduction histidine kinase